MLADRVTDAMRFDPVSLEEFGALLARDTGTTVKTRAGTSVGTNRALGITAWYSGVRYLSEQVAGLPVHRFRRLADDERQRRPTPTWMRSPDVEQTWYGLMEHVMMALLHAGNAYMFKVRDPFTGQVVGLREIHPERVTTGIAPDNRKRFVIDRDERTWTTRDILHVPGLAYNGRFGMNPLRLAAEPLGVVAATDEYAARFFGNGTHLGGVISVEHAMTSAEAEALSAEWDQFHKGILNSHQTGVLSKGARYDRISLNAQDTQLLESRQWGVLEVARLLRIPPHKLYELTRATFSNIEHQSIEAVTDGVQPWVERIEAWFNADPDLNPQSRSAYIEFSLEGRLRGDTEHRFNGYNQAIGGPWMTVNEVRRLENLPPIAGGDEVMAPLNMGTTTNHEVDDAEA